VEDPALLFNYGGSHGLTTQALKEAGVDCYSKTSKVPTDFGGSHYYEYDLKKLGAGREALLKELEAWAKGENVMAEGVRAL
jgi:hypothetical protein